MNIKKIHPTFTLNLARTFRSTSLDPNVQNIPVRNEQQKNLIRRGFVAPEGAQFVEWDFGQLEFRILAAWSQDPEILKYVNDDSTDIHADQRDLLYLLDDDFKSKADPKLLSKGLRFFAKNDFVFALIYGSKSKPITRNLIGDSFHLLTNVEGFEDIREYVKSKLRKHKTWRKNLALKLYKKIKFIQEKNPGYVFPEYFYYFPTDKSKLTEEQIEEYTNFPLNYFGYSEKRENRDGDIYEVDIVGDLPDYFVKNLTLEEYEYHIKDCIKAFWERFSTVKAKQVGMMDEYKANGFVRTPLGFEFRNYMTENDLKNYIIQGTGFNIVLWCVIQVHKWLKKNKLKSKVVGTIHDSIVLIIYDDEYKVVNKYVYDVMTKHVREKFPSLLSNVPLLAEPEAGLNWADKEVIKFSSFLS